MGHFVTSKRDFRARAHSNPLNDAEFLVPEDPCSVDWSPFIPDIGTRSIDFVDLGCGYGGLLCELSTAFPEKYMLGMEIRDRVASYCVTKLEELRRLNNGKYRNIGFIRTNCMKFLPFYFPRSSVEKFFICFPDPHFKKKKHRQRLVSLRFLSEAAYCLQPGGMIYIVTDVEELFHWMNHQFAQHPLFLKKEQHVVMQQDVLLPYLLNHTDEAQRMKRRGQETQYWNVFQRK
ncbi:hypothetical protein GpartN1_g7823.t1 [Galdieria partita]|uniref:tRNA (guanine-N(7)-)-methyltransferase n=1 Tax=Galdieria partita TaxID=83374 RepID=A0A9C7Q8N8_9RHOD|nr:hypothetical protein GpartN1_g7777.t1 [Galdieria partita]GJQ16032.1 hypothetical protein GpartN1_g7823.t1 [Galdieria partita]